MEQQEIRDRWIRTIPRHAARELSRAEIFGMTLVAALGLTGVLGTLVIAWMQALT